MPSGTDSERGRPRRAARIAGGSGRRRRSP